MKIMNCIIAAILLCTGFLFGQSDTSLVLLLSIDPQIKTDVRYATKNNFTGKVLYPSDKIYLRKVAAVQLSKVNTYLLKNYNLRLKVYDGYRPLSVQKYMWSILPDANFVADPAKGSKHNRGAAVDLTLIDSKGNELEMGTPFDDFTLKARPDAKNITAKAAKNRKILRNAMLKFGFKPIDTEWWHYDYKDWNSFHILDVEIK